MTLNWPNRTTTTNRLALLLIEDSPAAAQQLQDMLAQVQLMTFDIAWADNLAAGLERLAAKPFDLILLDLSLPDSRGLDTLLRVRARGAATETALIAFTSIADELLGPQAVQAGAQDYLVKEQLTGSLLIRAIHYALERNRMQVALRNTSWTDELTGLYNRRGFLSLAAQYTALAPRVPRGLLLLHAGLVNFQDAAGRYGPQAGEQLLIVAAQSLQKTFRRSDLLARIGAAEFAILMLGARANNAEPIHQRLQANVAAHNSQANSAHQITLQLKAIELDASAPLTIEDWLARVGEMMNDEFVINK